MMNPENQETKPQQSTDKDAEESYDYVAKWEVRFGKHKGVLFKDVPDDYLNWAWNKGVINNEKVNNYISDRLKL